MQHMHDPERLQLTLQPVRSRTTLRTAAAELRQASMLSEVAGMVQMLFWTAG